MQMTVSPETLTIADSGRVKSLIHPVAQDILYTSDFEAVTRNELASISHVDFAHLLMLRKTGILHSDVVAPLIAAILDLRHSNFEVLRGRPAPRGTYMLYESWLIERLGSDIGGHLQTARSRNDLSATVQRMRHREALAALTETLLTLERALLAQARLHLETPFPLFTHYQAAQTSTLAHYFLGVVVALQRGHASLENQFKHLAVCPLGAGAIAGTGFPIDTEMTAVLLGFETGPANSIEVIASRDHVLRSLHECMVLGVTVSRLAHDMQLWTTQEYGLLEVEDDLVGISSMMPQKRNIYMTENIKGRLATAQGAAQAAAVAMHFTPFSNSISVGTESTKHFWPALQDTQNAMQLMSLMVAGVTPRLDRIEQRLADGFCAATALADGLVRHAGLSFRDAHHAVGDVIRNMLEAGLTDLDLGVRRFRPDIAHVLDQVTLRPEEISCQQRYGGGPAPEVQADVLVRADVELQRMAATMTVRRESWQAAWTRLDAQVKETLA